MASYLEANTQINTYGHRCKKAPESDSEALYTNFDGGILAGHFRFSLANSARHQVSEGVIGGEIAGFRY
jgi:hypothetical protein